MPYTQPRAFKRVWYGIGGRISRLGERLGSDWLIYNPIIFQAFHEMALSSAPGVIKTFEEVFPRAKHYVDVGAGSCAFAAEAVRRGHECVACEHSATARRLGRKQGVDVRPFDLTHRPPADLDGPYDLAYCFEVAEHLPASMGSDLVAYLASLAPVVVFTAAPPGQAGHGHINLQPKQYWIDQFERHALRHCPQLSRVIAESFQRHDVVSWLVENVMVFERMPE
jgi:hypothetical protein